LGKEELGVVRYIRRSPKTNMTMSFLRRGSWRPKTMWVGRIIKMESLMMSTMLAESQKGN
jgi:hypothetical protein